jgi:hypothetical protein
METRKDVVSYDYKTIKVKRDMETMVVDTYGNLGWEFVGSSASTGSLFHINLSFKRDRNIENKQNLLRLQEKAESTLQNIEYLQDGKGSAGLITGITTGTIGALTFGGGMSMAMLLGVDTVGFMIGGIALGVVGIGIALLAFVIRKKVKRAKLAKIEPALENEYNKLADICEQAK